MPAANASHISVTENIWIPLSDGRRLAARIWLPEKQTPAPAILEYLPYRKRDGTAPRDETTHRVFAEHGYACVRVDIAGTGDSEGLFDDEYSEQELSDGEAVLAWIAEQDWCDGNIGMIGISWGGFNGLQLAFRRPHALKAIVSVASTTDRYADDIHFMGGCLLSDNANWAGQMLAYLTRPADPELRPDWREDWLQRLENLPDLAADWLAHPNRDNLWKHGSVCEDWQAINIPVLAITGWADAYINTPTALAENLTTPCKALIGPWEHRYAHISKIEPSDFHSEVLGWFDRWLKGELNGAEDLPDYRTFMTEHSEPRPQNHASRGRWIAEQNWPSPHVSEQVLYPAGAELGANPSSGQISLATPAHLGQASGYFCPGMRIDNELPDDQAADDALSACFEQEIGENGLELLGRPVFSFRFSSDQPVAQLVARLCDVAPDGTSQRITWRAKNLTHFASHEAPEALTPGKSYQAHIRLNECAHFLRPGHKLRLALSTSYWPIIWPAPKPAVVTLDLGQSSLSLPVRNVAQEPDPCAPGPAREFPTLQGEELRKATSQSATTTDSQGYRILETFDDYGAMRDPYHGLEVGSTVAMRYAIHPDDPASAAFHSDWEFTFARGDWQVRIQTASSLTCDQDSFFLTRKITATEGPDETEVFARTFKKTSARGLL